MLKVSCIILLSLCAAAQGRQVAKTFPIPENMIKIENSAGLGMSYENYKLLKAAVDADLREMEESCDEKSAFEDGNTVIIPLGKLGEVVFVRMSHTCVCGATGNCPISAYAREKTGYRAILKDGGWGYAVVDPQRQIPDVVFAWHMSAGQTNLSLFRYTNGKFNRIACEEVTPKDEPSVPPVEHVRGRFWYPAELKAQPCKQY